LIENIHKLTFKNLSRILNILKNEIFQVSIATVPEIISTMNRHFILDTKKTKEYMYFPPLLNLLHKNFKKITRQIQIIVSITLNIFSLLNDNFIQKLY
jgi:hypothetical protein